MREDGIRSARQKARALLHRFGVRAPEHVQIEAFAKLLGAAVVEAPLDGAKAQLVRTRESAQIVLSERVTDVAARRFSIAHELGHLVLDHPSRKPSELCGPRPVRREAGDARDHEAEANTFAAELLMPESLVRHSCEVSPVDLAGPRGIADAFGVSILAAAIRFAELASERCAAVFSARGAVKWFAPSKTFTREIRRGKRLDPHSVAYDYFATGDLDERAQPVPADAWLETSREVDLVEHSVASRELRTVLSMLWIPEASAVRLGM